MITTRQLLKEELLLNDRRNKLSSESLALINNPVYVKHILGIDIPLNESISFELRKLIIEEEERVVKFGQTLKNYIGGKIAGTKEAVVQVVTNISTLKDAAVLIWDLWIKPEYMIPAMRSIKGVLSGILNDFKTAWATITNAVGAANTKFKTSFDEILVKIENVVTKLINGDGLFSFISIMGFAALLKWLYDSVIKTLIRSVDSLIGLKDSLFQLKDSIIEVLNSFKEFKITALASFDIQPILDWFDTIANSGAAIVNWFKQANVQHLLGHFAIGIQIIGVLAFVLAPVLKSISWTKKLEKGDV